MIILKDIQIAKDIQNP